MSLKYDFFSTSVTLFGASEMKLWASAMKQDSDMATKQFSTFICTHKHYISLCIKTANCGLLWQLSDEMVENNI
jgi:hypothetical protein